MYEIAFLRARHLAIFSSSPSIFVSFLCCLSICSTEYLPCRLKSYPTLFGDLLSSLSGFSASLDSTLLRFPRLIRSFELNILEAFLHNFKSQATKNVFKSEASRRRNQKSDNPSKVFPFFSKILIFRD